MGKNGLSSYEKATIYFAVWINLCTVCVACGLRDFIDITITAAYLLFVALVGSVFRLKLIEEECITLPLIFVSHVPLALSTIIFLIRLSGADARLYFVILFTYIGSVKLTMIETRSIRTTK